MISVSTALADDKPKGTYALVGSGICLISPGGFKDDGHGNYVIPNGSNTFESSSNFWDTATFNGDGTGTTTGKFAAIAAPSPAGPGSAAGGTYTYQFKHSPISGNEYTTSAVAGTFKGTIDSGPRAGQTFMINKVDRTHIISMDQKSITVTNAAPYVEEITYSGDPKGPFQRICNIAGTFFKLQ